jgi:GTP-binding protein
MKELRWNTLRFLASALAPKDYPELLGKNGKALPEIAICGRSNVGKSSLINTLFGVPNLAHTSKRAGKTRLLNFFSFDDYFGVIDLPGYGYAEVSGQVQNDWVKAVEHYFRHRKTLDCLLLLVDIRRPIEADDLLLVHWAEAYKKEVILVFTKVDKVTNQEKLKNKELILSCLPQKGISPVYFSTKTGEGVKELRALLKKNYVTT